MKEFISMYKNIFNFKGRARRREYWIPYLWMILLVLVEMIPIGIGAFMMETNETVGTVVYIVIIIILCAVNMSISIANLSLTIRRYHDVGLSGWWYLLFSILSICGVGGIIHLIIMCIDSNADNKWGPNPKNNFQCNNYQNNGNYNYQNDYQNNGNYNYQNDYQNNADYNQQNNFNGDYSNYNENNDNFRQ